MSVSDTSEEWSRRSIQRAAALMQVVVNGLLMDVAVFEAYMVANLLSQPRIVDSEQDGWVPMIGWRSRV